MKASELISQLQELIEKNGDQELVLQVRQIDWTYNLYFPGFVLDEVYDTDSVDEDEWLEGEYFVCGVSI